MKKIFFWHQDYLLIFLFSSPLGDRWNGMSCCWSRRAPKYHAHPTSSKANLSTIFSFSHHISRLWLLKSQSWFLSKKILVTNLHFHSYDHEGCLPQVFIFTVVIINITDVILPVVLKTPPLVLAKARNTISNTITSQIMIKISLQLDKNLIIHQRSFHLAQNGEFTWKWIMLAF